MRPSLGQWRASFRHLRRSPRRLGLVGRRGGARWAKLAAMSDEARPRRQRTTDPDEYVIRIVDDPAAIDADAWSALLAGQPAATPFISHAYLRALHQSRARSAHRLGAAVPRPRACRRAGRRLPAVPQGPLLRRVRVRLGLGRRLPAPRPRVLPEAAVRGAVHAGARPAPAGADATSSGCCCCAASSSSRARPSCRRCTCSSSTTPTRRRRARRAGDAPHGAVPLDATASPRPTPTSTSSSPACSATSARRSSRSGAASPKPA